MRAGRTWLGDRPGRTAPAGLLDGRPPRRALVVGALQAAAATRGCTRMPGAIFHTDRGSEYASGACVAACQRLGLRRSMGRTGSCLDNAAAEGWFASLKVELVDRPLPHPGRGTYRHLRLDRLVQPLPAALGQRLPTTRRVGTAARPQPATIDHGRITPVSTSRGELQTPPKPAAQDRNAGARIGAGGLLG
jgi:transposase InsO family protein